MQLIISKSNTGYVIQNPPASWETTLPVGILIKVEDLPLPEKKEQNKKAKAEESTPYYHKKTVSGHLLYQHLKEANSKEHIIEIEKKGNNYVVKNIPANMPERFFIKLNEPERQKPDKMNDTTYQELKAMAEKHPENTLLQKKLKYYSPYPDESDFSDDDALFLALKEKYDS